MGTCSNQMPRRQDIYTINTNSITIEVECKINKHAIKNINVSTTTTILQLKRQIHQSLYDFLNQNQMNLFYLGENLQDNQPIGRLKIAPFKPIKFEVTKKYLNQNMGLRIMQASEPQFITAMMVCGHAMTQSRMVEHIRDLIRREQYQIKCKYVILEKGECNAIWDFEICAKVGMFTKQEREEFYGGLYQNKEIMCPKCTKVLHKDKLLQSNNTCKFCTYVFNNNKAILPLNSAPVNILQNSPASGNAPVVHIPVINPINSLGNINSKNVVSSPAQAINPASNAVNSIGNAALQVNHPKSPLIVNQVANPLLAFFSLKADIFYPKKDFDLSANKQSLQFRGGYPYYQPPKGMRFALNVSGKYDEGNNSWLNMNGADGQWAIAFHGIRNPAEITPKNITVLNSIINQIGKSSVSLIEGKNQGYATYNAMNSSEKVGNGIYCSPHIEECLANYCIVPVLLSGINYKIVLACKINPKKIKVCQSKEIYWVINQPEQIRPYGIILVKEQDYTAYPKSSEIYKEEFTWNKYKDSITTYIARQK